MVVDGTPDRPRSLPQRRRAAAIPMVEGFIASFEGAGRLPANLLIRYQERGFGLGWLVPVSFSDGVTRELCIVVDDDYPYTQPKIAVANGPGTLAWPHLEVDGFLCILPSDAAVSDENVVGVVEYLLREACCLIEDSIRGKNVEDFRHEFLSYWSLAADRDVPRFISLLEPEGPGRSIRVWRGSRVRVAGECPQSLQRWLRRWGARTKGGAQQDYTLSEGALIWLPEPLLPTEYPDTAADVRALAHERSPEAVSVIEELAASGANQIDVVMGAHTPNGACFAALGLRPPSRVSPSNRRENLLIRGFRPGRVPHSILVNRYLSGSSKVTRIEVERADHRWIHGRDQDPRQQRLRRSRVAMLGCGSVGGSLARLLAQAGVGDLLLVDPDTMDWPNVGRHELGAASVKRAKARELAREIERAYPHLGEISWRQDRVGPKAQALVEELASCELIVSTMGNWAGENFLNDVQQESNDFPAVLYGWLEPNAAAAHAVFVCAGGGGACLRCGLNDKGQPTLRVTDWARGGDDLQAPACGARFTPYGPSELCWAHALLAEASIDALLGNLPSASHRVWIGSRSRIEAAGGTWCADWIERMGDPKSGGLTVVRSWPASPSCPVCTRGVRAV